MENYLFIGGHRDGLEIPLAEDVEFIQLADGDTGRETYIRDTFAVGRPRVLHILQARETDAGAGS